MKQKIFCLLGMIMLSLYGFAQTKIIVVNKITSSPIVGAEVSIKEGNNGLQTNENGEVTILLNSDLIEIVTLHADYKPSITKIKNGDKKKSIEIELNPLYYHLNEVVFSANKFEEKKKDLAQKVEVIGRKDIQFFNPVTSGDLLAQEGKVFVQTSQQGGGSPVLRGFEANKVLMVVDGVRMNNAIYRGGHLQNVITLDPFVMDRVETAFGPSSVMYGSDALGGVMHFYTIKPKYATGDRNIESHGCASARYTFGDFDWAKNKNPFNKQYTSQNSSVVNALFTIGGKKWAVLFSGTSKDIGDLRMGSQTNPTLPGFGLRNFTQQRINDKDTAIKNVNPFVQTLSGYTQNDVMFKFNYKASDKLELGINVQNSNSSNINRYDRLTEVRNGLPRFGEWYYGPQKRLLGILSADYKDTTKFFDLLSVKLSYQDIEESRINRNFGSSIKSFRTETVGIYGFNADLFKQISKQNEFRYGFEYLNNLVQSEGVSRNLKDGSEKEIDTRYPSGGSTMNTMALYASHSWEIIAEKLIFSQGIRFSSVQLESSFRDSNQVKEPISNFFAEKYGKVSQSNTNISGNLGLVYLIGNDFKVSGMFSRGFRAPNVDDMGKIFESTGGLVILPNPELKPEITHNLEGSISKNFFQQMLLELTFFQTWMQDALAVAPSSFNGSDSLLYDGTKRQVVTLTNKGKAIVNGIQLDAVFNVSNYLTFKNHITYTYGRVIDNEKGNAPLDHIPPVYGQSGVRVDFQNSRTEFFVRYNGWKKLKDYSSSGEDNLQYATAFGMPSWYTLNLKTELRIRKYIVLQTGMDNILDKNYRMFASGISASGRNVYFGITAKF